MKQILLIIGLLINISFTMSAQESKIDSILDVLIFEDKELLSLILNKNKYEFLYARTTFRSNTYFAGRDIGIDQTNMTGQLYYFNSSGINLGIGGIMYNEFEPKLQTMVISAGYSNMIKKSRDYRIRASYDRYIFAKSDSIEERSFNSALNFGATIDKDFIGSRADVAFLMGNESSTQLSWDVYGDFTLLKLNTFDKIKFEPEISFLFGREEVAYYEIGGTVLNPEYVLVEDSKFGMLNAQLMLPITIDYKNFDFEFGYNINFPHSMFSEDKLPVTTYFNISLGYIFSLN